MSVNVILTGTTMVSATSDHQFWLLGASSVLTTEFTHGFAFDGQENVTLSVAGALTTNGTNTYGIYLDSVSDNCTVTVESTGSVVGNMANNSYGIRSEAAGTKIVNNGIISGSIGIQLVATSVNNTVLNYGEINANNVGVSLNGSGAFLMNSGSIMSTGSVGVTFFFSGGNNTVINTGSIEGGTYGVSFGSISGPNYLFNSGTISSGGPISINGNNTNQIIHNTGIIDGRVKLYGGDDVFDSSNGVVLGKIVAGGGNDTVLTGAGAQTIIAGGGDDLVDAGAGSDTLKGNAGNDVLRGRGGNDNLEGGAGDDVLRGGSGADELRGGSGEDLVIGGTGNDTLFGGADIDVFKFGADDGVDKIKDYVDGEDLIDFSALGIVSFAALSGAISSSSGNAIIDLSVLGGSGVITVIGAAGDLSVTDFIL